jgi:hypothetical protein
MPTYPISVPVSEQIARKYSSKAERELAKKIESYINENSKYVVVEKFDYKMISRELGISINIIREYLCPLSGSRSSITIQNPIFHLV